MMPIAELPFRERPLLDVLGFDLDEDGRYDVDRTYTGYGWARADELWLVDGVAPAGVRPREQRVNDALVIAVHSADDGPRMLHDIELEFELPAGDAVTVLASQFLDTWLPTLPQASAIVLTLCNPCRAELRYPASARVPLHIATGGVEAWFEGRVELIAEGTWTRLSS